MQGLTDKELLGIFAAISAGKLKAQELARQGCQLVGIKQGNFLAAANRAVRMAKIDALRADYIANHNNAEGFVEIEALSDDDHWEDLVGIPADSEYYLTAEWETAVANQKVATALWKAMNKSYKQPNSLFMMLVAVCNPTDVFKAVNGNGSMLYCFNIIVGDQVVMGVCPHNRLNKSFHPLFGEVVKNFKRAQEQAHLFEGIEIVDFDSLSDRFSSLTALAQATVEIPEDANEDDVEII